MELLARSVGAATLVIALAAAPARAADDSQIWTGGTVTAMLSHHWRVSEEITARFSDNRNGLYEIESNTLVGYRINNAVTVWAGYTHDPNYSAGNLVVMEHRAREQVTFDNLANVGAGRLSGRLRFEQRWREGFDGTGWRLRPYVKFALPLRSGARTDFVLSTEAFFNLNATAFQSASGIDRTRTFAGISVPLGANLSADLGYLNQHTFIRDRADTDDHVASVSLSLTL